MSGLPILCGLASGLCSIYSIMTLYNLNCYSFIASLYPTEEFPISLLTNLIPIILPSHQFYSFFNIKIYINFRMT